MPDMPGVNIIVAAANGPRFYAALEMAMASAALGQSARIFLQGGAVVMLRAPVGFAGDGALKAAGLPNLAAMLVEAAAMEIGLFACQSGLALMDIAATQLVPQARTSGLVSFLADVGPADRLLIY